VSAGRIGAYPESRPELHEKRVNGGASIDAQFAQPLAGWRRH
jgi:hypothetical protein